MTPGDDERGHEANPAGTIIGGRYRVVRKLGAGQMGEVVEAEDTLLRRHVAVKVIRHQHARAPGFADRLRLEAQAVAAVAERSVHVVSALDLGRTDDGRAFVVFERLVGRTLREELKARKYLAVAEAITLTKQLLDGLAAAHEAGIVHRDIKPENVFLCERVRGSERVLKILDFGIAKVIEPTAAGAPAPLAAPTAKGMLIGTPRYLAPERVLGQLPVDLRSDIYAAGMLLYVLLAGRDPYHHHRDIFDILTAQVGEKPRAPSFLAEQFIPAWLDAVVVRAIAKDPGERFPDAKAFATALTQRAQPPAPSPRAHWQETERVDLSAFRTPSPTAAAQRVEDEAVATMPLPVPRAASTSGAALARPVLLPAPPRQTDDEARGEQPKRADEQVTRESEQPTVPLVRRWMHIPRERAIVVLGALLAVLALEVVVLVLRLVR